MTTRKVKKRYRRKILILIFVKKRGLIFEREWKGCREFELGPEKFKKVGVIEKSY